MKVYNINEKVTEGERNLRRGRCILCEAHGVTNYLDKGEGYMVWIPSRGKRMVCSEYYLNRGVINYHSINIYILIVFIYNKATMA